MAAFVFARFAFRGREVVYAFFTLGLLFPIAVAILPLFVLLRSLGLLGSPLGVALPQAAFALPLTIVILRPFFGAIPNELEDAARVDGCSTFGFLWRIVVPCRVRRSRPSPSWRSSRAGTPSSCRCWSSRAPTNGRCRSA